MGADQTGEGSATSEAGDLVPTTDGERRTLVVGGSVLGAVALGWFVLSHVVIGTATVDALVEVLGVVLALLILASVVGAVRAHRRGGAQTREPG